METLSIPLGVTVTRGVRTTTLKTEFESGKIQRRSKGLPVLYWKFKYTRPFANGDQFFNFYIARKGSYEPFYFVDQSITYTVAFIEDDLSKEDFMLRASTFGVEIEQVI
jgi:hypothetical protein